MEKASLGICSSGRPILQLLQLYTTCFPHGLWVALEYFGLRLAICSDTSEQLYTLLATSRTFIALVVHLALVLCLHKLSFFLAQHKCVTPMLVTDCHKREAALRCCPTCMTRLTLSP